MNILITLPRHLIEKIMSGEKQFEMRKCLPKQMKIGEDGFFVVEKGTGAVRCWCRVDNAFETDTKSYSTALLSSQLCVPEEYIRKYANNKKVYLWEIGKVIALDGLEREMLNVDKNPQQFVYCPLSYGELDLKIKFYSYLKF